MSLNQRKSENNEKQDTSDKTPSNKDVNITYTEAGHVYMSPKEALFAIFKGQTKWCTSNFLRGLFMLKLLIACFCGILFSAMQFDPYKSSFLFLFISLISTFYVVVIKCKIDIKRVFHSFMKPFIHRLHFAYLAYFSAYVFYSYFYQQIKSKHF